MKKPEDPQCLKCVDAHGSCNKLEELSTKKVGCVYCKAAITIAIRLRFDYDEK